MFEPKKLSTEHKEALRILDHHYYFGMFQQLGITKNDDEEYQLRDAISAIAEADSIELH